MSAWFFKNWFTKLKLISSNINQNFDVWTSAFPNYIYFFSSKLSFEALAGPNFREYIDISWELILWKTTEKRKTVLQ